MVIQHEDGSTTLIEFKTSDRESSGKCLEAFGTVDPDKETISIRDHDEITPSLSEESHKVNRVGP